MSIPVAQYDERNPSKKGLGVDLEKPPVADSGRLIKKLPIEIKASAKRQCANWGMQRKPEAASVPGQRRCVTNWQAAR